MPNTEKKTVSDEQEETDENNEEVEKNISPTGTPNWILSIGEDDTGAGISEIDGGFIIGGTIWSYGAGRADGCFIKIDDSGNVLWSETVGGNGDEGINWDGVRTLSDGGFILGEGTTSYGAKKQAICCMRLNPDCSIK